jgi:hypothetical protein
MQMAVNVFNPTSQIPNFGLIENSQFMLMFLSENANSVIIKNICMMQLCLIGIHTSIALNSITIFGLESIYFVYEWLSKY